MVYNKILKHKYSIAIAISLLFHVSALIGLIFTDKHVFFKNNTPTNLYVTLFLIIITHKKFNLSFWLFFGVSFISGLLFEIIGVNTQLLFGSYEYSNILGLTIFQVPIFLGCLWFVTMYIVGCLTFQILNFVILKYNLSLKTIVFKTIFELIASSLAVLMDYFLEPIAINFNLWNWLPNGEVPIYNYVCWFFCSAVLQVLFINLNFSKENKFASFLCIIQCLFFIILIKFYI